MRHGRIAAENMKWRFEQLTALTRLKSLTVQWGWNSNNLTLAQVHATMRVQSGITCFSSVCGRHGQHNQWQRVHARLKGV